MMQRNAAACCSCSATLLHVAVQHSYRRQYAAPMTLHYYGVCNAGGCCAHTSRRSLSYLKQCPQQRSHLWRAVLVLAHTMPAFNRSGAGESSEEQRGLAQIAHASCAVRSARTSPARSDGASTVRTQHLDAASSSAARSATAAMVRERGTSVVGAAAEAQPQATVQLRTTRMRVRQVTQATCRPSMVGAVTADTEDDAVDWCAVEIQTSLGRSLRRRRRCHQQYCDLADCGIGG